MEAIAATQRGRETVMKRWDDFKAADVPALNRELQDAKLPELQLRSDLHQEESQTDEE